MAKYVINGPAKLSGTVQIGGSKNAVLKELAAALLATEPVTLANVPAIRDVPAMLEILEQFGIVVSRDNGTVTLDPSNVQATDIDAALAQRLRSSVLTLGPAVARFGRAVLAHPGGDVIGKRPIDIHLKALESLGATVDRQGERYVVTAKKLTGAKIFLEEASVTATENAMMAAVLAKGTTVIHNAASELHTADLADLLNAMGAQISGAGTNLVEIHGVTELKGATHRVRCDEIEAATFMIAGAITGGELTLEGVDPDNFGMILIKLREAGVNFSTTSNTITVTSPHQLQAVDLKTETWPGFPTDLTSPFTVLMIRAEGKSLIHDHMYDGRFFYTDKLVRMGADITMADPHRIIVFGPTALQGRELASPDLRAGMTMVLASLVAEGTTTIEHIEHIERGYADLDGRLRALGADIQRIEE